MEKNSKSHSLGSKGLKYKLRLSFYLMSIIPLLVCVYLVSNYILPQVGFKLDITLSILISIFISFIGFLVIKEIFDRIVSVTSDAKLIASGDIERKLEIKHVDEVGDLGAALNQLTQNIRNNMEELKHYSQKTSEINMNIQQRVAMLSSLFQISSLISQAAKLEEVLKIIIDKALLLSSSEVSYLLFREEGQDTFYLKLADGINSQSLIKADAESIKELFNKVINTNSQLILDKDNKSDKYIAEAFYEKFRLKNTLALPVYLNARVTAILGIGNTKDSFTYTKEDMEFLDIFAKQVAIALENDLLLRRVEKLEIKDALTGLYNEAFIHSRLQEEIKRAIAYQRPCAFIVIDIDNFKKFHQNFGLLQSEAALKKIAALIQDSITEIDRAGRTGDDEFAVILPEKNKRKAQEIAEEIRKKIEFVFSENTDMNKKITVSAGVSENPLDGINDEELFYKARDLVKYAKKLGRNRVVWSKKQNA